jgi:hypothetical protein
MTHVRAQIRQAIAEALLEVPQTAGRVYVTRVRPLGDGQLPALTVATGTERSEQFTDDLDLQRELQVNVSVHVRGRDDFDDEADDIAAEVEQALMSDPSLDGLLFNCFLSGTQPEYSGEGEQRIARLHLTFLATYHTAQDDPENVS